MTAIPQGYRFAAVASGIKESGKADLSLIVSDTPATAAGVYTTNLVCAAPVVLDRDRTPATNIRAIVVNSGNANACTGDRGIQDACTMASLAAQQCGADPEDALVLSTGIIGEFLPMPLVSAGITAAAKLLASDEASVIAAAQGMMTTDTHHKLSSRTLELSGRNIQLLGMAKGAAMIGPKMATMLGVVLTDAALDTHVAQMLLSEIADQTFNCISVDGHMSTNDTVLLLANGAAGGEPLEGADLEAFREALLAVCMELAKAIPADGEGATHLITIDVEGCLNEESARKVAKSIADSPLVKTAIAGGDPNWGRIVSAAGYAGVRFDPAQVHLTVNNFLLYQNGAPTSFDEQAVSDSIRNNRDTHIHLTVGTGPAHSTFWTTDLTAEYVRLNADYRT